MPIVASLFDGGSIPLVVDELEQAGAVDVQPTDSRHLGGTARVVFTAPVREVADLASRLPDVRWLELEPRMKEDDVNASRFIQSGTNDTATVWDRGLHGEGQIIGMLEGNTPDIAHCFFADPAPNTARPGPPEGGQPPQREHRCPRDLRGGVRRRRRARQLRCQHPSRQRLGRPTRGHGRLATPPCSTELTDNMNAGAFVHTNSWHDNRHGAGIPAPYNQVAVDTDTFLRNNEDHVLLGSVRQQRRAAGAARHGQERALRVRCQRRRHPDRRRQPGPDRGRPPQARHRRGRV